MQELPEFFGGGARFPGGGETFERDRDRMVRLDDAAVETGHLEVRRDAMGNLREKRRPVEAIFDQTVEHLGAVDDLVEFSGPFLRGGHFRFDFLPLAFGGIETALDLDRPIGVPAVVEEEDRAESSSGR